MAHPQWTRDSEELLIETIKKHRCLWDHRDDSYMKKGLKRVAYSQVASELKNNFPELATISTDQVRSKFNNLRTYFLKEYRKICGTASGTAGGYVTKWKLFEVMMSFLKDTLNNYTTESTENFTNEQSSNLASTFSLSPDGTLTEVESYPLATPESPLEIHESTSSRMSSPLSPEWSGVPVATHSPSHGSSQQPFPVVSSNDALGPSYVSVKHLAKKRKKSSGVTPEIDEVTESLKTYIDKKNNVSVEASSLGSLVEATYDKLPYNIQLLFMQKLVQLIVEMKAIPPVNT
ncbi:uncharacterized protein LOC126998357 [Eriocheir sinensis]|uniref:uncharacterized protein LOC126998357 n=1 Tax=Eriocheir sinensis TaxID=95602 RepID=UPI0021C6CC08|nr:uncharacterized protein LOC126998357 [Eriocheir sinensis]